MAGTRREGVSLADQDAGRPLSEREKQQIARLLSDPMEFPMGYRAWVKNFIETVGIQLPRSSIVGLKASTSATAREVVAESFPAGTILRGLWKTPPPGTVLADGSEVARADYPQLADALGARSYADSFTVPKLAAPEGESYAIVTGTRPHVVRESEV